MTSLNIDPEIGTFKHHTDEIDFLKEQGFATNPLNTTVDTVEEAWSRAQEIIEKRDSLAYPIDGLVVKLNDNKLNDELGVVGKTHRGWCAIKFPAEEATTRILDVTWQVGRTGKLTPVAELEPVLIAGTTVKRATLHNAKEFEEKDLHTLDTLVVRKAGDIIPEVVQVLTNLREENAEPLKGVHTCPECQTELVSTETGVDLVCPNIATCPAQRLLRLSYFTQRSVANIQGLSEKIIERFIQEFGIEDIYDLYDLPWEKIKVLEGFGEKSAQNLQKAIEDSKTHIEDYKFLAGLGIQGVGPEVAKLILSKMDYK